MPSESMPELFLKALSLLPSSGTPAEEPARTPEAELDTPLRREEGSLHYLDPWSRKVDNPDDYPINRTTTPAHDLGGYAPDDPKGWAA